MTPSRTVSALLKLQGIRVLYKPQNFVKQDTGLFEVDLAVLQTDEDFKKLMKAEPRLFHTSVVHLNWHNLPPDSTWLSAAQMAQVITSALQALPPKTVPWDDVINTLKTIAQNA